MSLAVALTAMASAGWAPGGSTMVGQPIEVLREDSRYASADQAQEYLVSIFDCLHQKRASDVISVTKILNLRRSDQAIDALLKRKCTPKGRTGAIPLGQTGIPPLRGALFVALYRAQFSSKNPGVSAAAPVTIDGTGAPAARREWFSAAYRFANCVARSASNEARVVVLSRSGSEAASHAFRAMDAQMANCLGTGEQFTVSRPVLAGLFAEALYRSAEEGNS